MFTIVIAAAIILVAAYMAYLRFFAKKGTPKRTPLEALESLKASEAGKKKESHKEK